MAEQSVILQPGESRTVSFEVTPMVPKTYSVSVDGQTGSFLAKPLLPVADCAAVVIEGSIYQNLDFSGWISAVKANTGLTAGAYKVRVEELEAILLYSNIKVWMYVGSLGDLWEGFPYWLGHVKDDDGTTRGGRQPMGLHWEGRWERTMPGTLASGAVVSYVIIPNYKGETGYAGLIPMTDTDKLNRAQAALNAFAGFHNLRQYTNKLVGRIDLVSEPPLREAIVNKLTPFFLKIGAASGGLTDLQVLASKGDFVSQYTATKILGLVVSGHSNHNTSFCFAEGEGGLTCSNVADIRPRFFEAQGCETPYIFCWKEGGKFVCIDNPPYYGYCFALVGSSGRVMSMLLECSFNPAWCFWDAADYLAAGQPLAQAILSQAAADPRRIYGVLYGDPTFTFV